MDNLVDAMALWLSSKLEDLHTVIPGKVEKYDEVTQTVDVLPLLSKITIKNVEVALPVIPGVPVIFPSGQAFQLKWEVQKGDGVLLLFSEAALGAWVNSDGTKQVRPESKSRFSETDAIAILGLAPKVVTAALEMYIDKTGKMTIGSGASPFVKGDTLGTELTTFLTNMSIAAKTAVDPATALSALQTIGIVCDTFLAQVPNLNSLKVSAE